MPQNNSITTQVVAHQSSRLQLILQGFAFPVAVFFMHQVGIWLTDGKYWWDEPLHVFGGAAIVWLLLHVHQAVTGGAEMARLPRWYVACWLVAGAVFVGVAWEWYEFVRWMTFDPGMDLTLADTLKDLCMDTVGAWAAALAFVPKQKTRR